MYFLLILLLIYNKNKFIFIVLMKYNLLIYLILFYDKKYAINDKIIKTIIHINIHSNIIFKIFDK